MKTKLSSNELKNENSKQHKCWNCHENGHYTRKCSKKESIKPISKSKKRRLRYHTLIAQKDAIIDQQKFMIDDLIKDIKRLTERLSEQKLYYETL
jgi:hypothetical protein